LRSIISDSHNRLGRRIICLGDKQLLPISVIAWIVVSMMELTSLSRYVWHLPLFFLALIVLFSSLIGMVVFP
jgi:hypothetical protein